MKKLIAFATVFLFVAASMVHAQDSKYMYSQEFVLKFSEEVTIKAGGATQKKTTSEWEADGKVGKSTIDAKTFQKLQDATSGKFLIQIEKKSVGTLHGLQATDQSNGKIVRGVYNSADRKFTFGSAKSQQANGATKTDIGVVKGQFSEDMKSIKDGEFGIAFILGNEAAMIGANAIFYFTATEAK